MHVRPPRWLTLRLLPLVACAPFGARLGAQELAAADPVAWTARVQALRATLEQRRQDQHIAGLAFALVRGDEVVLAEGFGERDAAAHLPVTAETTFAIGSTTKAFTATLIGMLADEGLMSFDDPVEKFLPGFRLRDAAASDPVLLRDLLCHRTGICRQSLVWINGRLGRDEILTHVPQAELRRPFRSTFQYNNVMFLAAGMAAARAAGQPYEELIEERILEPLGMASTHLSAARQAAGPDHAKGYQFDTEKKALVELPLRDITSCAPAGAIYSSAVDMAKWLRFLLARGVCQGEPLISPATLEATWQEQTIGGAPFGYGLGWFVKSYRDHKGIEHGGNIDGFSASVGLLPDAALGYVLLTSAGRCELQGEIFSLVWDHLLGDRAPAAGDRARLGPAGPALGPTELAAYEGRYDMRVTKSEVTLTLVDERLVVQLPANPPLPLEWPDTKGRWAIERSTPIWVEFERSETGFITALDFHQNGRIHMPRIEQEEPLPLTVDELCEQVSAAHASEAAADLLPLLLRGKVRHPNQGLEGDLVLWTAGPERFVRFEDYGPVGQSFVARDGARVTQRTLVGGLEAEVLAQDIQQFNPWALLGDWYDTFLDLEVVRAEHRGLQTFYVVKCRRASGAPVIRFVDAATGRLAREQGTPFALVLGGDLVSYEDYREVAGVPFPCRQIIEIPDHGRTISEIESMEPDTELPAEVARVVWPENG